MKKQAILSSIAALAGLCATAQTSKIGSLHIGVSDNANAAAERNTQNLRLPRFQVLGEVVFTEPQLYTKNGAIDAGESCKIMMKVRNTGDAPASGLVATIVGSGSTKGLTLNSSPVDDIPVGKERIIEFPILAGADVEDGKATIGVALMEPHGMGTKTYQVQVPTRAFRPPLITVTDHAATSKESKILKKTESFDFQLVVTNIEKGVAENVGIDLKLPKNVICLGGSTAAEGLTLRPGESTELNCKLVVNQNYSGTEIPIGVTLSEKFGKYAQNATINLALMQEMNQRIVVPEYRSSYDDDVDTRKFGSDVDKDIPSTSIVNNGTYVLIIANGRYDEEPNISTALNDGEVVWQYCRQTLGIPEQNIALRKNMSLGRMRREVAHFARTMEMSPESKYLVFYFGHGMTDKPTGETYLIPSDGNSEQLEEGCYRRGDMLEAFGRHKTAGTLIFMESCFSGGTPEGEMLSYSKASSGVKIAPSDEEIPEGNIVMITASSGVQTANAYEREQHNLFTYYLLKNLQESKGDIALGELFSKASESTRQTAHNELRREQDPDVISAPEVGDSWKNWKLK